MDWGYWLMSKQKNLIRIIYDNEKGLLEKVHTLIDENVDLNRVTEYGESALRVAANNGRFDVVKLLIDSGADRSQLGWSNSFYEVAFGTPSSLEESIKKYGDIENRDFWERTPWLLAIQVGDIEKTSLLLELGANRNAVGRCQKQPMAYAIQQNNIEMLRWLVNQGFDIESTDKYLCTPLIIASEQGMTDCVKYLIDQGADIYKENHIPERAIQVASSLDIINILLDQGDDINDISEETHALLLGTRVDSDPEVSQEEYFAGKHRRFGTSNPEKVDVKFWVEMIRSGASAWHARTMFKDESSSNDDPVWCYKRYGKSTTVLENGTIIEIAGEHEDHYDPDFCIYNDVIVFGPDGDINLFTYPEEVFPPTDFHTATLVDDNLIIIGNLGYPEKRIVGKTQVYSLNTKSFEMKKLETTGDSPGWIHDHKSTLSSDNKFIELWGGKVETDMEGSLVENIDHWRLNLETYQWVRKTQLNWRRWDIFRTDKKTNHLWEMRQAVWSLNAGWKKEYREEYQSLRAKLGIQPDFDLLEVLYNPDIDHEKLNEDKVAHKTFCIVIEGVLVRYVEDMYSIQVTVEGELPDSITEQLQQDLLAKLSRLENTEYEAVEI
jgi:ankyrin repeat protein